MRRLRRAQQRYARRHRRLAERALTAGAAAVIVVGGAPGVLRRAAAMAPPDPHLVAVGHDADGDRLTDAEEIALGYRPFCASQNGSPERDGVELALRCARVIDELPLQEEVADPNEIHKVSMLQRGLEHCDVCGEPVNMGYSDIVNPKLAMTVQVYDIALHYMEHGSFSHAGNLHQGRLNVPALMRVLEMRFPFVPDAHVLPLDYTVEGLGQLAEDANDADGDVLADSEELAIGSNLHDPDQDENLTPDGVDFATQCAEVIDSLQEYTPDQTPSGELHKVKWFQKGLEFCEICGASVNMGYWEVTDPKAGRSMQVYEIELHYMRHGSFSHHGLTFEGSPLHAGRTRVGALAQLLGMPRRCGDLGTIHPPGDVNIDCRFDLADLGALAHRWLESTDPGPP